MWTSSSLLLLSKLWDGVNRMRGVSGSTQWDLDGQLDGLFVRVAVRRLSEAVMCFRPRQFA